MTFLAVPGEAMLAQPSFAAPRTVVALVPGREHLDHLLVAGAVLGWASRTRKSNSRESGL